MSFKILKNNCCGLDVHKTWIYACIGITDSLKRTEYKEARFSSFTKGLNELCEWLSKHNCTDVCIESTGKYWIPVFNVLEKNNIWVTLSHPKYTKPQKGNKTDRKDAKWICDLYMCEMVKPSFIPPADIRELRDLVRYRFKLTCMITGEKNRAHNCLTVSNLKLDDVFSDIFGKSSRSIKEQILQHPGETFDVAHFVDGRCKTPVEEIQAAVDGAISKEQAVKLRQCLNHIDELEMHKAEIEREIFRLSDKYESVLSLIRTVPGFDVLYFSLSKSSFNPSSNLSVISCTFCFSVLSSAIINLHIFIFLHDKRQPAMDCLLHNHTIKLNFYNTFQYPAFFEPTRSIYPFSLKNDILFSTAVSLTPNIL